MSRSSTGSISARTHERRKQALALRVAGATEREVAQALGISQPATHRMLHGELTRLARETRADAEQWRAILITRYELVIRALHRRVLAGEDQAIDRYLRAIGQESELLGLALVDLEPSQEVSQIQIIDAESRTEDGSGSVLPFMSVLPVGESTS
jgi:hypothetical protein